MHSVDDQDLIHVWDKAANCLAELASARLFITGGTGFFGSWLLESLRYAKQYLGLKTEAVVLTRDPAAFAQKMPHLAGISGIEFVQGDVRNFVFPAGQFTHVIHAATEASAKLNSEEPLCMLDTIVDGTRRVLDFAVRAQAKKMLLTSSGAVYGRQPPELSHVPETYLGAPDSLNPAAAYGVGKRLAEHLCVLYAQCHPIEVKIARCFAFVGPYLPLTIHFAIGNFIHNVLQQQPIQIAGDGSPYRSYLYAADLVVWLWTILCQGKSGRAYNVGSAEAINIADLAQLVAEQSERKIAVSIAKKANPTQPAERYVPAINRAQQELNLQVWINLPDAIQRTIQWSLQHAKAKSE